MDTFNNLDKDGSGELEAQRLVDDGGVFFGEAVVGQVLVSPLSHGGGVHKLGQRVDVLLVRHAGLGQLHELVLEPDLLVELEVLRAQLRGEAGGD